MEIFLFISVGIFSIIGLCDLMHYIKLLLLKPSKKADTMLLIRLSGESDFENINYINEKYRWHGGYLAKRIVFLFNDSTDKNLIEQFEGNSLCFISEKEFNSGIFGVDYGESGNSRHS